MKKKIFAFLVVSILCLTLGTIACAEEISGEVVMTIPINVPMTDQPLNADIRLQGYLLPNRKATLTLTNNSGFVMRNELNPAQTLPYSITHNGSTVTSGTTLMTASAEEVQTGKSSQITFQLNGTAKTAGTYRDTCTFTLAILENRLTGIAVTTPPSKTQYRPGEAFSPAGMVVTAYYEGGGSGQISGYTITNGSSLQNGQTSVTVSYTEGGVTKTASTGITVSAPEAIIAAGDLWYKSSVNRESIQSITFLDRYYPNGRENESWDASRNMDGSVMGYRIGNDVIVSGNGSGRIRTSENCSSMFDYFTAVRAIEGLSVLDTSAATNMSCMFALCYELQTLDVSGFDTSKVETMNMMFFNCQKLTSLQGLNRFNTSRVKNMDFMLSNLYVIPSLDVASFDVRNVTTMKMMFGGCNSLQSLSGVYNWQTSSLQNASHIFSSCVTVTEIDLSRWDMSHVTDMSVLFGGCSGLKTVDLRNLNTSGVTAMDRMFSGAFALQTVYVNNTFSTSSVSSSVDMFWACDNLVGAVPFNSSRLDASMANYTNGYFTYRA